MRDEARRVIATPSDQASFRAYDLNLPQSPSREMIFAPADLAACNVRELPQRDGPVVVGLDMGEATSASAAFAIWPLTGRVESWLAFGDVPSLRDRGQRDGAHYELMAERGELRDLSRPGDSGIRVPGRRRRRPGRLRSAPARGGRVQGQ